MKYRKKPVIIEATQWFKNGDHPNVKYFRHQTVNGGSKCDQCGHIIDDHGWVETSEGGHIVCVGDYIITGVKGEYYPCKPDIFELTYEPVDDTNH